MDMPRLEGVRDKPVPTIEVGPGVKLEDGLDESHPLVTTTGAMVRHRSVEGLMAWSSRAYVLKL